ncbi:histidine phosphatase family protein [Alsobacter sp. SYSU M60028]|uniref:Histidine phosphatase family protein n=1 Tax=Alsobacter ponti TaxID=2962936 RepID=A0ABT1LAU1_9HYPH|nr:histidine phosphatase family protein [Alsobacter ponti]MCP8938544.1 histidine phosphatase family protein [Alsobacter ponti]
MTRTVFLIRHGQSTFNAHYAETGEDPGHIDAPLSELGLAQVAEARARMAAEPVELVVASPLTRAIQTAFGIFDGRGAPFHVTCMHREKLESSCDIGRSPRALAADFPHFAFDHLADPWWHCGPADERGIPVEPHEVFQERVARFRGWLLDRPERAVAVVGHGTFFRELTGRWFANCEVVALRGPNLEVQE